MSAWTNDSSTSDEAHRPNLVRAVIASTVGTAIEWYDFFLYSTVTGLVFAKEFFPKSEPLVGTLEAFLIYAVGFVARPIGALIFGHFGDRMGRKAALVATLLLMGIATVLVGFVPNYAQIGIWGAILLTILRFIQGVGVGGEWGGSVLLAMEWGKTHSNRGFIASWPQFGVPCGLFLSNLAVLIFSRVSGDQFHVWGWRVPFFLSGILIAVGLWIRLGILETPVFAKLLSTKNPAFIVLGVLLGAIAHSSVYGPQAALIAEQFTPRMRYSGASIGYQLASIIAGGPAPLVAAALLATYKSGTPVAIYVASCAAIGFLAALFMTEYSGQDISGEYAHVGGRGETEVRSWNRGV
jgi:MFS family permease